MGREVCWWPLLVALSGTGCAQLLALDGVGDGTSGQGVGSVGSSTGGAASSTTTGVGGAGASSTASGTASSGVGGGGGGGVDLSACAPAIPSSYADAVAADDPHGYWPLDDNPSLDTIQNVADGTAVGFLLNGVGTLGVTGQVNGALLLDVDDAVDTDTNFTDLAQAYTFEAWIQLETQAFDTTAHPGVAAGEQQRTIVSDRDDGNGPTQGVVFDVDNGGRLRLVANAGEFGSIVSAPKPLPAQQFVHVVAVHNGFKGVLLYVNGDLAMPGGFANPAGSLNTASFMIGADFNGQNRFFDGIIDEVAVYLAALEPERIRCHYAAGVILGM
jgi:hypothetical protein